MREKFAIGVSILAFVALYIGLGALADVLVVPRTLIPVKQSIVGPYLTAADTLKRLTVTPSMLASIFLIASAMLAWRAYHWVVSGKPGGNLKREQRITWFHWFAGLTVYVVITTPFGTSIYRQFFQRFLVLGVGVGTAAFFYKKHQKATHEARNQ